MSATFKDSPVYPYEKSLKVRGMTIRVLHFECGANECCDSLQGQGDSEDPAIGYECKHLTQFYDSARDVAERKKQKAHMPFLFSMQRFASREMARQQMKSLTFAAYPEDDWSAIIGSVRPENNASFKLMNDLEATVLPLGHVSYRSAQALLLNYLAYRFYEGIKCGKRDHGINPYASNTVADFNKIPRRASESNHRSYDVLQNVAYILSIGQCVNCVRGADRTAVGLSDF